MSDMVEVIYEESKVKEGMAPNTSTNVIDLKYKAIKTRLVYMVRLWLFCSFSLSLSSVCSLSTRRALKQYATSFRAVNGNSGEFEL